MVRDIIRLSNQERNDDMKIVKPFQEDVHWKGMCRQLIKKLPIGMERKCDI